MGGPHVFIRSPLPRVIVAQWLAFVRCLRPRNRTSRRGWRRVATKLGPNFRAIVAPHEAFAMQKVCVAPKSGVIVAQQQKDASRVTPALSLRDRFVMLISPGRRRACVISHQNFNASLNSTLMRSFIGIFVKEASLAVWLFGKVFRDSKLIAIKWCKLHQTYARRCRTSCPRRPPRLPSGRLPCPETPVPRRDRWNSRPAGCQRNTEACPNDRPGAEPVGSVADVVGAISGALSFSVTG